MEEIATRKDLIEQIFTLAEEAINYDKSFSYDLMINKSVEELQAAVEDLKLNIRMDEAARTISRCFSHYIARKRVRIKVRERNNAARKIQKQWKFFQLYHYKDIIKTKK